MTVETNSEPQGGCLHLRATGTLTASQLRSALLRAEERLFTHAWQIEQLLPDSARDGGEVLLSDRR